MEVCTTVNVMTDEAVAATLGLYSNCPTTQLHALQVLSKEMHCVDLGSLEANYTNLLLESSHLSHVKHVLKTSKSAAVQMNALQCLNFDHLGESFHWFDLMGFLTNILVTSEEKMLLHTVPLLKCISVRHAGDVQCLNRCGIVDALCIRITSATDSETAVQLVLILFSLIRLSAETQASKTPFSCATTVLSQKDGALSEHSVQLACLEALQLFTEEPGVNVVGFLHSGLVHVLMKRLESQNKVFAVQRLILQVFSNLSSSLEAARLLLEAGLLDILLGFLKLENVTDEIFDLLFWLVGKITGDYVELRDMAISSGSVGHVVTTASSENLPISGRRRLMRVLAIFFRPDPDGVPAELAKDILQIVKEYLCSDDSKIQLDALFGLQCLTIASNQASSRGVDYVVEMGFVPCLLHILRSQQRPQSRSALAVISNIAKSQQRPGVQLLLENGLLPCLAENLRSSLDVIETMAILQSVAKCEHTEAIFAAISVQLLVDLLARYAGHVGKYVLEIIRLAIKEDRPGVLQQLLESHLLQTLRGVHNTDHAASWSYQSTRQDLGLLASDVEALLKQAARKCGMDIDSEAENSMDCDEQF